MEASVKTGLATANENVKTENTDNDANATGETDKEFKKLTD